jgi:hypothetical protein
MSKRCQRCAVSSSTMRLSENDALSSVRLTLTTCATSLRGLATSGNWMRYSSKSTDASIAVDRDGDVLDILVQGRRDKEAAKKFFRKLLKGSR